MAVITIVGAGMMGSALAFPARENGHTVKIVGTHLDRRSLLPAVRGIVIRNLKRIFRRAYVLSDRRA